MKLFSSNTSLLYFAALVTMTLLMNNKHIYILWLFTYVRFKKLDLLLEFFFPMLNNLLFFPPPRLKKCLESSGKFRAV